jgi:hypothetical protein
MLKQIVERMSNTKNSSIVSVYPKLTDFNNDSDEDADTDIHNEETNNNFENDINSVNKKLNVYYRGLCNLNVDYPSFKKASILYYKIKTINNFPVLLFKLYKNKNKLEFYKNTKSVDKDASYMGHYIDNNDVILVYNIDDYKNSDELLEDQYFWVVSSEIINRRKVFHFPIDDEVCDFFLENKEFLYIETEKKEAFESPEVGYKNNISELQFMLGPILSKTDNYYQYDFESYTKKNVGRELILKIDTFISPNKFGIQNLNQRLPLAYLSA